MAYTASVSLGSPIGIGITSVKLYECSGNNSGCTALANYTNVAVSLFNPTYLITGITDSNRWLKIEPVGACSGTTQNLQVSGFPGPTSTPAPTATTPSATPAPTATTPSATPAPTATVTQPPPTPTPSATTPGPTATALPGCGSTVTGTYAPSGYTLQTVSLNLSGAINGSTISVQYTANNRPNRFNIYGGGNLVVSSLWAGSDTDYQGPWTGNAIDEDGSGYITFVYNSSLSYQLKVDVGGANPSNILEDSWEVSIQCLGVPSATATPTPTATTPPLYGFYRSNPKTLSTGHCNDNQVTSALFYSTSSTIANMLGKTGYTDTEYTVWLGGGFYYAVSSDNQFNTNNPPYYVIKVDNFGEVIDVQYIANCTSGGANA